MDLYLLVGNPRTRKASVARSLTGCFNRSVRDIQPADGRPPLRLYARVGALQEAGTTADDLAAEAERARCGAVLCCLWPAAHPHDPQRLPEAADYVAAWQARGWRLRAAAVLGQNGGGLKGPCVRNFPLAPTAPVNVTAHAVRAFFDWV